MKALTHNLNLLYNGDLQQNQTSTDERSYYYNLVEYALDEDKYLAELIKDPSSDGYLIREKSSAYSQESDMDSYSEVAKNPSVQQALFYLSGLEYILTAQLEPKIYFGMTNGLYYASPYTYLSNSSLQLIYPLGLIHPACFEADPPLKDPPPMQGYDIRCRKWYQKTMNERDEN